MHPTRNLFAEYKGNNRVFVETGSYRGDGIQLALEAGYETIISIDNDPEAIEFCKNRFDLHNQPNNNIQLVVGDSAICLAWEILGYQYQSVTFWLDSHWQMLENTKPGENPFPLMMELDQIADVIEQRPTIIIDDMLIMQKDITGYDKRDIERKLLSICPRYQLQYFANPVINNILVAHV